MSSDLRARHRWLGAPRRRSASVVPRLGAGLLSLLLLSGCTGRDLGLPVAASDRAQYVDELWVGAWIAAGVIGVFVAGLGVWAAVAYRRRSDDEVPKQVRYNLPLEVLYTVAPVIVIAVFFFHTVKTNSELLNRLPDEADHRIVVIGQKWSWSFNYMEEEATNGEAVFTVGTPADRPTLMLPVNETVRFDLQSQDVIHAFWVPAFYFKLDVLPGQGANEGTGTNTFSLTPTREGTYAGRCSELCGLYHSRMLFTVEVVSREEFDEAMVELQEQGNTGELRYASEIEKVAGLEDQETAESATEDGAE